MTRRLTPRFRCFGKTELKPASSARSCVQIELKTLGVFVVNRNQLHPSTLAA